MKDASRPATICLHTIVLYIIVLLPACPQTRRQYMRLYVAQHLSMAVNSNQPSGTTGGTTGDSSNLMRHAKLLVAERRKHGMRRPPL